MATKKKTAKKAKRKPSVKKIVKVETIAQKALRLLRTVPASDFITGQFTDGSGKCCAIGHFHRLKSKNPDNYSPVNCEDNHNGILRKKSIAFMKQKHDMSGVTIAHVNNEDYYNGYTEPTIKGRVVHMLKDMVKAGF